MDYFDYYFDFQLGWFNKAVSDPSCYIPKTMTYLNEHFEGTELDKCMQLIMRGLRGGREKMIKHTRGYLLHPPYILLVMVNRSRGPAFLRAVLAIFDDYSDQVPDGVILIHDMGNDWG